MTKVDIRRLDSVTTNDTTATQLINENFTALQTAIENTISRDGTTPNFMNADLDLNSYKIINAGTPTNNTDVITKEYFDEYVGDAPGYASAAEQAANRASTAAQAAQGYSSVASGAADVAQRARDFIESDPSFIAVSADLLLGANSEIRKVNDNKTNINTVAGSISNVNTVSTDIANVNAVAGDLTNIDSVATNMTDINNVADDLTKIVAVADDLTNIDNVADDLTKIDNVADNLTNIDAVANNTTNINAVAGNESKINAVASNESNINSVNANKTNIDAVAGNNANITAVANNATNINAVNANKTNIDAVAGNNSNIAAVANNESNINAVNANKTNIDTVAANNADISKVADDIANVNAVAGDLTNIDAASGYAAEAKQWAIGDPTEPTGGSAKYWAGQAAAGQVQADWTEADTTAKSYIKNKPTAGDNISLANNQISTVSDASPTLGSTKLVQSGGVYTSLNNLQTQIDAIVASSDVYDIVATYAALQAYDITTVPVNDIVKVLVDETHSGAATYYRCVESGGVKSWSYIGSEGAYYTKGEADVLLAGRANTDLSNLSTTGQAVLNAKQDITTAVNYDNISNCITEIPQDIKLELNSGTLTLKAGSKVYVPNGFETDGTTPKFDEVVTSVDKIFTSGATWSFMVYYNSSTGEFNRDQMYNHPTTSGPTAPENPYNTQVWYDTTNNLVKRYLGNSWTSGWSLPLAIITATGSITSIDQAFNGFGYIGSTVFALPNVKGLIPNGRNADGSLKNIIVSTTKPSIYNIPSNKNNVPFYIKSSGNIDYYTNGKYHEDINKNETYEGNYALCVECGNLTTNSSGVITSLTPKTAFHAVDYNDFNNLTINVLKAIYSVGAVYIGTTSTCPLASFFGTWTLKSSGIVTSVDSTVAVAGNGKALNISNSESTSGDGYLKPTNIYYGQGMSAYNTDAMSGGIPKDYTGGTVNNNYNSGALAVTTDATKSGLTGTLTRSTLSVNIWERTA